MDALLQRSNPTRREMTGNLGSPPGFSWLIYARKSATAVQLPKVAGGELASVADVPKATNDYD